MNLIPANFHLFLQIKRDNLQKNSPSGGRKGGIRNHKSPQIEPVCAGDQGLISNDLTDDFKSTQTTAIKTHSDPGTLQFDADSQSRKKVP